MKRILVVAAVIRRDGRILIARRPSHLHMGGLWEFPGGKVEPGEPVEAALLRELDEELGIIPTDFHPLIRLQHDYPDKAVCLDVWEVTAFRGEPEGREGQPLAWVAPERLRDHEFPAANHAIVTAARLPDRYLMTPDGLSVAARREWLAARLAAGARLILFRDTTLPEAAYRAEAVALLEICVAARAQLMLHGSPARLAALPAAAGLHLPARMMAATSARPVPADKWLAVSVHDAAELAQAVALGADFVTLSPVQPTVSHPGAPGLGWAQFAAWVEGASLPVYALGGLKDDDVALARQHGAQGVAGIRGLFAQA
ncbi:MAG: Nudix family hydrolase [Moraxellaceae bacterium]